MQGIERHSTYRIQGYSKIGGDEKMAAKKAVEAGVVAKQM
jgi:hypothetical protein